MVTVTTRASKGAELTYSEVDSNFTLLRNALSTLGGSAVITTRAAKGSELSYNEMDGNFVALKTAADSIANQGSGQPLLLNNPPAPTTFDASVRDTGVVTVGDSAQYAQAFVLTQGGDFRFAWNFISANTYFYAHVQNSTVADIYVVINGTETKVTTTYVYDQASPNFTFRLDHRSDGVRTYTKAPNGDFASAAVFSIALMQYWWTQAGGTGTVPYVHNAARVWNPGYGWTSASVGAIAPGLRTDVVSIDWLPDITAAYSGPTAPDYFEFQNEDATTGEVQMAWARGIVVSNPVAGVVTIRPPSSHSWNLMAASKRGKQMLTRYRAHNNPSLTAVAQRIYTPKWLPGLNSQKGVYYTIYANRLVGGPGESKMGGSGNNAGYTQYHEQNPDLIDATGTIMDSGSSYCVNAWLENEVMELTWRGMANPVWEGRVVGASIFGDNLQSVSAITLKPDGLTYAQQFKAIYAVPASQRAYPPRYALRPTAASKNGSWPTNCDLRPVGMSKSILFDPSYLAIGQSLTTTLASQGVSGWPRRRLDPSGVNGNVGDATGNGQYVGGFTRTSPNTNEWALFGSPPGGPDGEPWEFRRALHEAEGSHPRENVPLLKQDQYYLDYFAFWKTAMDANLSWIFRFEVGNEIWNGITFGWQSVQLQKHYRFRTGAAAATNGAEAFTQSMNEYGFQFARVIQLAIAAGMDMSRVKPCLCVGVNGDRLDETLAEMGSTASYVKAVNAACYPAINATGVAATDVATLETLWTAAYISTVDAAIGLQKRTLAKGLEFGFYEYGNDPSNSPGLTDTHLYNFLLSENGYRAMKTFFRHVKLRIGGPTSYWWDVWPQWGIAIRPDAPSPALQALIDVINEGL